MLWLAMSAAGQTATEKLVGDRLMPNLVLTDINGKKVNVQDYGKTGGITVFSFWATWCVPCKKELTNMADLADDWKKNYNAKIVAVSIDDSRNTGKVKPLVDGQRWDYDVLLDVNQDLKRELNIQSVPYTIVVDKTGKIAWQHSGYVEGDENVLGDALETLSKK